MARYRSIGNYVADNSRAYNVHNARSSVEKHLGSKNFKLLEYGEPGRYRCNLQFPKYGEGKKR